MSDTTVGDVPVFGSRNVIVSICVDNSSFGDDGGGETMLELGRILSELTSLVYAADDIDTLDGKPLRDANGNKVGRVVIR